MVEVDRPMKALSMHTQAFIREELSKFSQLSFCQKLFFLNQTPSCIFVPSKPVVEVDRPMKALSMHTQAFIREELSKFSQLSFCQKLFLLNQTPSCICSMCLNCIGKYQIVPSKAVVGIDWPMYGL